MDVCSIKYIFSIKVQNNQCIKVQNNHSVLKCKISIAKIQHKINT